MDRGSRCELGVQLADALVDGRPVDLRKPISEHVDLAPQRAVNVADPIGSNQRMHDVRLSDPTLLTRATSAHRTRRTHPTGASLDTAGLRHAHKTMMIEIGTPQVLPDDRVGHADGSVPGAVQARHRRILNPPK
jgi:hypothetical protein